MQSGKDIARTSPLARLLAFDSTRSSQPAEASPEQRSYRPRAQSCQGQEDFLKGFLGELKGLGLSEPFCAALQACPG